MENIQETVEELLTWLKVKVDNAGAKGLVFGLSGGVDSAVLAGICKLAFPDTSLGIIMPCHSDKKDEEHALIVSKALGLDIEKIDLTTTFDTMMEALKYKDNKLAIANIKPRLRMTTLYYYAQNMNFLVAGASNKSEFTTGYFTKHGDSGVDLLPLVEFLKTEIWELANYLDIPEIIINKAPSAGLWNNQTDEDEMGFSYHILDKYIDTKIAEGSIKTKIETMYDKSLHKRHYPPIFTRNKKR
ncbi:MAG TPA: NAD(+) synthase [Tissierellaceae bacterium]|nr:NAD(+) synthase [Tissierellaceae bacterium]